MEDFPRWRCFSPDIEGIFHRKWRVGLVAAWCWGKLPIAQFGLDRPWPTLSLSTGQLPYNPCKPVGAFCLKPFRAGIAAPCRRQTARPWALVRQAGAGPATSLQALIQNGNKKAGVLPPLAFSLARPF